MEDESFARQVDRRLASANILLLFIDNKTDIKPIEKNAIIESSLLQYYLGVFSYLNEILNNHNKQSLEFSNFNLLDLLNSNNTSLSSINEFYHLKEWSKKHGEVLTALAKLPLMLSSIVDKNQSKSKSHNKDSIVDKNTYLKQSSSHTNANELGSELHLISVNNIDTSEIKKNGDIDLFDRVNLCQCIQSFQTFIESQRDLQVEY